MDATTSTSQTARSRIFTRYTPSSARARLGLPIHVNVLTEQIGHGGWRRRLAHVDAIRLHVTVRHQHVRLRVADVPETDVAGVRIRIGVDILLLPAVRRHIDGLTAVHAGGDGIIVREIWLSRVDAELIQLI